MKFTKRNPIASFWLNDRFATTLGRLSLAEIVGTVAVPAGITFLVIWLALCQ